MNATFQNENAKQPNQLFEHECNWVEKLSLHQFRNYSSLNLSLLKKPVVICGQNGAGKTNLLEAISLLCPGQGLRRAPVSELGNFQADGNWAVSAKLHGSMGQVQIGTGLTDANTIQTPRRKIKLDGQTLSSSNELANQIQILWLTPQMDGLFTGPASDRRRFLDRLMIVFNPHARKLWNLFERAMRQRNKLLETQELTNPLFEGLELQMAEYGVALAAVRLETITRLQRVILQTRTDDSPFPYAILKLEGRLEQALELDAALDVEDHYLAILRNNRGLDRAAKRTLEGPHRTDFFVSHGPKNMPAKLCSTGEQKALLTGLVLAHARLVFEHQQGVAPLLLLDEIAAHFDEIRRRALFEDLLALNCQAWMTGTDTQVFEYLNENAQILKVEENKIVV